MRRQPAYAAPYCPCNDSQDSILCDFLLDSKEPVSGIWIFGFVGNMYTLWFVQATADSAWVGDGWDCAAEDGEIEEGVRDGCIGRMLSPGYWGGLHGI